MIHGIVAGRRKPLRFSKNKFKEIELIAQRLILASKTIMMIMIQNMYRENQFLGF